MAGDHDDGCARRLPLQLAQDVDAGAVELTVTAGAGSTEIAGGFGNDWGVRLGDQCVTTLGEAGAWTGDRFVIDWPDD